MLRRLAAATPAGEGAVTSEEAKLLEEAASLRAELAEMESAASARRRAKTAEELLDGDATKVVGPAELRDRVGVVMSVDIGEAGAAELMKAGGGKEVLSFSELSSEGFSAELVAVCSKARVVEQEARVAEREEALKAARYEQEAGMFDPEEYSPVQNDDRGVVTRVISVLAYLLPLNDALVFGQPLTTRVPSLEPVLGALQPLSDLLEALPGGVGSLLFLVIFALVGNSRAIPRMLRFSLLQAVALDLALFLAALLIPAVEGIAGESTDVFFGFSTLVCLVYSSANLYAMASALLGNDGDGLPYVSDAAKRAAGLTTDGKPS